MTPDNVNATMLALCNGNQDAVNFILRFWNMCIVWDDAIDRDKHGEDKAINDAFMWALFGLQDDPFYQQWSAALRPAILQCIASWMVANRFEKSRDTAKIEQAYFLRCSPYDVFSTTVLLCSGFEKMVEAVEILRSFAPEDTLTEYVAEHKE